MKISLAKPVIDEQMKKAVIDSLQNERFVLGESVYKFEEEFARYCGAKYAISTNSGTDALHLALLSLGIEKRHLVITTPASFVATANAILHSNATPIFADIDIETYTIDPDQITQKITRKTKAIVPVHLYGYPAEMDSIDKIAQQHELYVVEDACQAHGALYRGKKIGTLGDIACFSFFPSKNITVAGDGGMVVTDDEEVAETVAELRDCGRKTKYIHDSIGYNARLNTINAAIGRVQLKHLNEWNETRRRRAQLYDSLLSDIEELILPPHGGLHIKPVYHLYVIRTNYRDQLKNWLEKNGIECGIHYPIPIHLQPVYQKLYNCKRGEFPKSEELCETCLSIPMHPHLTMDEVKYVSEKINEFYQRLK